MTDIIDMTDMINQAHEGKYYLITGVMNKKSIAYTVAKMLLKNNASLILSVQNKEMKERVQNLFPDLSAETHIYCCDLSREEEIHSLAMALQQRGIKLAGLLHSVAYANLVEGRPFHETPWEDFQNAVKISAFSLISLSNAMRPLLLDNASVVTVGISNTKITAYGYLGPIKGLLEQMVPYLAQSFSSIKSPSNVRFNIVCAGPLKTSASAGIPGYLENYLYSEKLMLRKKGLEMVEVANTIVFLLSPLSSGINGERIVIDGGMSCNYFDQSIVHSSL